MVIAISVILALSLVVVLPLIIFKNKIGEKNILLIARILAISFFALGILRCFMNDNFIWVINGGTYNLTYYQTTDILQSLLRWGMMLGYVVYPVAVYFSTRTTKNFAIYFCLPVAIVAMFSYDNFLEYFTTDSGRGIWVDEWFRHIEFVLELSLMIIVPILIRFCFGHKFAWKNWKEWSHFFGLLPLALLIVVPVYLPQSILGFTDKYMAPFTTPNFLWVAVIFGLLIVLYLAYRFKSRETRRMICVFLSLYLFLHYNSIYLMDLTLSRLPFQLCNLGSYLILIALLINKQGFYDFILMANVPGALIAFCVPDVKEGMLSYWNMHFYIEHTWVFVIPLLIVALRIADRPNKNAFKHFFIGFSAYFLFCAISGIIINCFVYVPNHSVLNQVNYFYIFDDTVLEVLPILGFTRDWAVTWGIYDYTFYPLYIVLIYILYSIFSLAVYWVYKQLAKVGDNHFTTRQIRIDLYNERGWYKRRKKLPNRSYED